MFGRFAAVNTGEAVHLLLKGDTADGRFGLLLNGCLRVGITVPTAFHKSRRVGDDRFEFVIGLHRIGILVAESFSLFVE